MLFLHFIGGIYLSNNIITLFHWFHLNNYTPFENKCFNPRNQIHRVEFVTRINSVCVQMRHAIHGVHILCKTSTEFGKHKCDMSKGNESDVSNIDV